MSEQTTLRIAPSPTGDLHLGNAMVALANRWFAIENEGTLILRIDDTDRQRSSFDSLLGITEALDWLGITFDAGPYYQSKHDEQYAEALSRMLADGSAYRCFCTQDRLDQVASEQRSAGMPPRYDNACRHLTSDEIESLMNRHTPFVVRIRVPDREYGFKDLVHGEVAAPAGSFGDFILKRTDGTHGYMFASVIDDVEMGITHVLRGNDHLANTPRQMAIFDALNVKPPKWAHLPLLLSEQGTKLSKRDQMGSMNQLMNLAVPPQALRMYLSEMLGQGDGDPLDPGSKASFSFERVSTGAARTSLERLESLAREVIGKTDENSSRQLIDEELKKGGHSPLSDEEWLLANDIRKGAAGWQSIALEVELIRSFEPGQEKLSLNDLPADLVEQVLAMLEGAPFTGLQEATTIVGAVKKDCRERGVPIKAMLQLLRSCLTGRAHGPGIDLLLNAIGREKALVRIKTSLPL